jgi:enoyl-CoA hydratase/carnithine racemase
MPVRLEKERGVGIVRFKRPECANALNRETLESLAALIEALRGDREVRVLITSGEGKGYSAGSDLEEIAGLSTEQSLEHQRLEGTVCRSLLSLPQPTIAAIHGYALGGGLFLAAYHDFRIVAANTRLGLPEVKLGWNPTFGMARLRCLVGVAAATHWLMSGDEIAMDEVSRTGLVTRVVLDAADVFPVAMRLAEELARRPPAALAAIKGALWQEAASEFERTDALETELFGRCLKTPEAQASLLRFQKPRLRSGQEP